MSEKKVVATVRGKHHTYTVVKEEHTFTESKYYVRRDGKPHRGSFSSLADAVRAAHEEAGPGAFES